MGLGLPGRTKIFAILLVSPCYYRDSFCKIYLHNKEISYGYDIFSFFLVLSSRSQAAWVETNVYSGWILCNYCIITEIVFK